MNAKEENDVCGNVHNMEKLFDLLDENDNGSIDRKEFTKTKTFECAQPKRPGKISLRIEKLLKLQYSNQEQNRLQQQIASLETMLTIERRRIASYCHTVHGKTCEGEKTIASVTNIGSCSQTTYCICAASKMQRFTRFRLYRKERALLEEARDDSSEELIACAAWRDQKFAVLKRQCWVRHHLAIKRFTLLRGVTLVVKKAVLGWYPRLKYAKIKASTSWIQKWWRRVSRYRSAYFTLVEAVHCIQSVLKRRSARKWFRREWHRQEKYLEYQVAAMRIQAAWRGRQQHMINIGSQRRIWLILEFSYGKDDLVDSIKPEDVLFLRNGCDAECEIVAVLSELVTTVIRTNDDIGNVGRESDVLLGSNGDLAQVEPTQEDETKDQNYPGTELKKPESDGLEVAAVPVSDITDDTFTSNQTVNRIDVEEGIPRSKFRTHEVVEKATEIDTPSLPITTENVVEPILKDTNAEEDIPMQDVVSSEASQDASSTTVDQSQQPLTGMFDADASGEDAAGSSINSTDLMMESDAMMTMQDSTENEVPNSARCARKASRMDSLVLLADLGQLNARKDPR
ncbi:EF-Hand 1, calcium-binding site [Phytophthora cactorum]|nr:EF-Hand 1, calcium-binding site [Phytophthora cactorum]